MNNLRRSRWSREIARGLIFLFLVPMLLAMPGKQANAQSSVKTIAVLDFENSTGTQGAALGRKAADSVCLSLPTDRYEVIGQDQIQKQIQALGLTLPLDRNSLLRLGKASAEGLGLEQIWTGRILSAEVKKGSNRQAHVKLEIRVLDVASGEYVNGGIGDASSSPRYDDVNTDVLLDDAVNKAADSAVRNLMSRIIPVGTVLLNKEGEVYINIGAQDGVRPGMEMVVERQGEKVGRIEVITVTNRDATAKIKEQTRGIMTEDRVKAVYTEASYNPISTVTNLGSSGGKKGSSFGKIGSVLVGVGLLMLAIKMFGTKSHVNVGATNVRAQATLTGNNQPGIHISWTKPSTPAAPDLLGFKVYRSTTQYGNYSVVAEIAGPYETQYVDTTEDRTIQVTQVGQESDSGTVDKDDQTVTGIQAGVTYYYRVSRIFVQASSDSSSNSSSSDTTFTVVESDMSEPTGGATPLEMPRLQSPSSDETINPTSVSFNWFSVAGGDQYRIQVSDSPSFETSRTYNSPDGDSRLSLPGGADNQTMSATLNISGMFPATNSNTGTSTTRDLFWRVGARHSNDKLSPDGGYIFSDAVRIRTQELPPNPVE